jgi:hypothetical protein
MTKDQLNARANKIPAIYLHREYFKSTMFCSALSQVLSVSRAVSFCRACSLLFVVAAAAGRRRRGVQNNIAELNGGEL